MRPARCFPLLLIAAVLAQPAGAQPLETEPVFAPGQRARVSYHRLRRPLIGEFVSSDQHALVIRKPGVTQPYYITWDKIARVEESIDQHTRGATIRRGMTTGLLLGIMLGTSIVALNEAVGTNQWWTRDEAREAAARGIVVTTIGGAILGITWPKDTWRRVPLEGDPPRLSIRPLRDGRVGLGISFGD